MRAILCLAALLFVLRPAAAQPREAEQIKNQSVLLLGRGDYDALNTAARQYRISGARTADGISRLSLFYAGFDALPMGDFMREEQWPTIFDMLERWGKKAPSPASTIALAQLHLRYAWERRGAGAAVPPQGQKTFLEHVQIARRLLDAGKTVASVDPTWAQTLARVIRAEQPNAAPPSAPLTIARAVTDDKDGVNGEVQVELQARRLFEQKKFHGLNSLAAWYRTSDARTPAGLEKLHYFYNGLDEYAALETPSLADKPNEAQWKRIFAQAQAWMDTEPSPAAVIEMASLRIAYAWDWRGDGFWDQIQPGRRKSFRDNLKIAHDLLVAHKADASVDPEWYVQMALLATEGAVDPKESASVMAEGLARDRYYYFLYAAVADGMTPKWGGSWAAVERFAVAAAERTKDRFGMGLYARVYQRVSCLCDRMQGNKRDWGRMKQGLEDILARYPVQWNFNRYALYACEAQDKKTARSAMQKITFANAAAWYDDHRLYDSCKAWTLR